MNGAMEAHNSHVSQLRTHHGSWAHLVPTLQWFIHCVSTIHTHTSEKSSNSSHMSRSPLSDAFQQENNSSCFPNTHFMAFFTSLGLFSQKFAHVIASFIVAPQPIDAAVQGHLGQLAFKSSFSSEFLFCFLLSPVHVFFCPPPPPSIPFNLY